MHGKALRDRCTERRLSSPPWRGKRACVRAQLCMTHGLLPARLLCPWDFPGKNAGVGCHFLLQWTGKASSNPLVVATLGKQLRSSFCKPAPFRPQDTHCPSCNYLLTPFPKANARLVRTLIYISLGGVRRGVKEQSSYIPESRVFRAALSSNSPSATSVD